MNKWDRGSHNLFEKVDARVEAIKFDLVPSVVWVCVSVHPRRNTIKHLGCKKWPRRGSKWDWGEEEGGPFRQSLYCTEIFWGFLPSPSCIHLVHYIWNPCNPLETPIFLKHGHHAQFRKWSWRAPMWLNLPFFAFFLTCDVNSLFACINQALERISPTGSVFLLTSEDHFAPLILRRPPPLPLSPFFAVLIFT